MGDWKPQLHAGHALSYEQFTIAIGELEYDDQFTAILSYDGRVPQPWKRVDVRREIQDLAYVDVTGEAEPIPIALGNEGDVYAILSDRVDWSKIPAAGVLSEDADGRGAVYGLLVYGATQYVLGRSKQLYAREGLGDWRTLSLDPDRPPGYEQEDYGSGALLPGNGLILRSNQRPGTREGSFMDDPRFRDDMTPDEIDALMLEYISPSESTEPITRLYHYRDETFTQLDIPEDVSIRDVYVDPMGRVWLVGVDGLIMRGRLEGGFERLDFHGDTEMLHSATWFQGELILAWGYGLYRFDGHRVISMKPKLNDPFRNQNTPTPMKLQTVGAGDEAVMFYFDYKHGVCRWDGETWDWIDIPPELLEREFSGLGR